jgi:hypothetical protein
VLDSVETSPAFDLRYAERLQRTIAKVRTGFNLYQKEKFFVDDSYALMEGLVQLVELQSEVACARLSGEKHYDNAAAAQRLVACTVNTLITLAPALSDLHSSMTEGIRRVEELREGVEVASSNMYNAASTLPDENKSGEPQD